MDAEEIDYSVMEYEVREDDSFCHTCGLENCECVWCFECGNLEDDCVCCPTCYGKGRDMDWPCDDCQATGRTDL